MAEMEKIQIDRIVIVEGKYDKIKLASFLDATILKTDGFGVFKSPEKRDLIRKLGQKRGLLVITDSDVAGMKIRSYIGSIAKDCDIRHIYIPQIAGKERRKKSGSKEGTLGVEGMDIALLRELFARQKIDFSAVQQSAPITHARLFEDGYIGGQDSRDKRKRLLAYLALPEYVSTKALLRVINTLMTDHEYSVFTRSLGNPQSIEGS